MQSRKIIHFFRYFETIGRIGGAIGCYFVHHGVVTASKVKFETKCAILRSNLMNPQRYLIASLNPGYLWLIFDYLRSYLPFIHLIVEN